MTCLPGPSLDASAHLSGSAALGGQPLAYTIRVNHTTVPSTRRLLNPFALLPDTSYKAYWWFANVQLALDRCAALL